MQRQVGPTNLTSAPEKFGKFDPPTFKGTKDPIEADNWLKEIERLFRAMEVSDEQQVILAIFVLKGGIGVVRVHKEGTNLAAFC